MLYGKQQQQPPQQPQQPSPQPPILPPPPQPEIYLPYGQVNLINDFSGLWGEIVIWMRSYIAAVAAGYPNAGAIADRISRIPVDFHDRLQLIFGKQQQQIF